MTNQVLTHNLPKINPNLKQNIRTCGINPNHWYVVARSTEVKDQPVGVILWKQKIVLYRDKEGVIKALEDRCPHRQVQLSSGRVVNNDIECIYHGWRFNSQGNCSFIPYLKSEQKLPKCQIKSFPVQELDGFVWLFLGDNNPNLISPLGVPEWDHLNYIATVSVINCPGHYSYLIENLMDMYHGHLHDDLQAWASASLEHLTSDNNRVCALYQAESYYRIDKIWSISQLFIPSLRQLHPEPLNVNYLYPHWVSSLGEDFKIYCLFCPIDETTTKAYLIHFTSLNAFWRLHKLPIWFRRFIKNSLFGSAQKLLDGLVYQDIEMIKQEQTAFLENPNLINVEVNPVIAKVQNLIISQFVDG
jgi:phenylpropionate dioxygenase-like ring-hydroxylating dioxygenase large terminal subunit